MNPQDDSVALPPSDPLAEARVRATMRQAWDESFPNDDGLRHEEGGYIVRNEDGSHGVVRWPSGGLTTAP